MLDVRVYRAAFIPALLAIFVVAFSLQGRPTPVRTRAVADAFDPSRAYGSERLAGSLLQLGSAFPERNPGSAGDDALADRVAASLRGSGFDVDRSTTSGRTVDGERNLETVVGVRPGLSDRRIVVLTHRDATDSPGLAELSGTAALLELGPDLPHARRRRRGGGRATAPTPGRGSSGATCARRWSWSRPPEGAAATRERAPGRARRIPP